MADPFIGEIRAFAFNYAPYGWSTCDGQILNVVQNQALFSLLSNKFGGNGQTTFGLPNLSGRAPMDVGAGPGLTPRNWADTVGAASVSLAGSNFPPHSHGLNAVSTANAGLATVANSYFSKGNAIVSSRPKAIASYGTALASPVQLAADAVQQAGTATGQIPHDNMQPFLPVLLCIAVMGIYPTRG
ncbi:MAG: phage tail protein [Geobacteraceae bacterium]|nr:phage tail protein [Geobacteraceae bacterium]